ncbi:MAG: hypothetical protein HY709_07170 [Candidatus Latescibacteria bacterium]|nr:hypothetical protein [Candidatus Latescibacterota bacterium]
MNDKELILLYWKFYTESHTNPVLKKYLPLLEEQIRNRKILPIALNKVGYEVLSKEYVM